LACTGFGELEMQSNILVSPLNGPSTLFLAAMDGIEKTIPIAIPIPVAIR